jgi:hypothetical protein
MIWFKSGLHITKLLILPLFVLSCFIYWQYFIHTPTGWVLYTNTKGGYSFIHPESWTVTDCGNGEVVVGKNIVSKCYYPLNASKNYIDNLYFQVFLPYRSSIYYPESRVYSYPSKDLKGWESLTINNQNKGLLFNGNRIRWDNAVPVDLTVHSYAHDDKQKFYTNSMFRIGLIYNPSYAGQYKRVFNSINFLKN